MPRQRIFYGWYVVAAVLVITTAASGFTFYNLSILLAAFTDRGGFPVSVASTATAIFFVAGGIGGMIAGRLVDRFDARIVIAIGATLGAVTLCTAGMLKTVPQLFLFHLALGLCHGASGLVPVTTVVARWFQVRRALAFSIASTGLSLGGMLIVPLVASFVKEAGLAAAAPWMGLWLFLGVVPAAVLVLRPWPKDMGLEPDNGLTSAAAGLAEPQPATLFSVAIRSRYFQAVSVAYLFLLGAQVACIAHLYRLGSTRAGFEVAALAVSTMAACSTIGRLAGGWLLLKISVTTFAFALMATQSLALMLLAVSENRLTILACAVLFGLTIGNSLMMHPLLLAERFGTRDYGRIYSLSQMITVVGVAGCPALVGFLFDASGGYRLPFLVIAGISALGLATLIWGSSQRRLEPSAPPSS